MDLLSPLEQRVADTEAWEMKNLVRVPVEVQKSNSSKFQMFKSRYMGRYNQIASDEIDMSYADFGNALVNERTAYKVGEKVVGTVASFEGPTKAMVEIGSKTHAVLPLREATIAPVEGETVGDIVDIGEQYEFEVVSNNRDDGQVMVSIRRIMYDRAWSSVEKIAKDDPVLEAPVVQVNRGGAIVLIEGLRAFLPGSHVMGGSSLDESWVGKPLKVKFLEVNKEGAKLVVSNKRAVIEHSMGAVQRGEVVEGEVTAVKPYGAFVEVLGMSGLLHISQISYDRVLNIENTLQPGMRLKCMIIDHDKSNGRIALSTKTLEPEPGDMLRDPQAVYDNAEDTAEKYHARIEAEREAREQAAKEMVLGLGDSLVGDLDGVASVDDGLDMLADLVANKRPSTNVAPRDDDIADLIGGDLNEALAALDADVPFPDDD